MLVAISRMAYGPTGADRALAVDFGFSTFIAGIAVLAARLDAAAATDLQHEALALHATVEELRTVLHGTRTTAASTPTVAPAPSPSPASPPARHTAHEVARIE